MPSLSLEAESPAFLSFFFEAEAEAEGVSAPASLSESMTIAADFFFLAAGAMVDSEEAVRQTKPA